VRLRSLSLKRPCAVAKLEQERWLEHDKEEQSRRKLRCLSHGEEALCSFCRAGERVVASARAWSRGAADVSSHYANAYRSRVASQPDCASCRYSSRVGWAGGARAKVLPDHKSWWKERTDSSRRASDRRMRTRAGGASARKRQAGAVRIGIAVVR